MEGMVFGGWSSLVRTLTVGIMAYVVLVVFLRISGKRTLSKLNAFDLVVTVALGSTLATVLLNKSVPLSDGILAFALLIGLQLIVTWLSVRVRWLRQIVTGEPLLLLYRGEFIPASLRHARVTEDEVRSAVRASAILSLEEVEAVVLETDGSLSVVRRGPDGGRLSLEGVRGYGPASIIGQSRLQ
ncbi:DUF421 domain-containing protein [Kineobactrum salinum]|uniref:DUF421 domain-containing protein n=1 Tax=Kineobactrum salinum TaxID=2708301 RepID=A0A6C0TZR8_9GAMM|nr:YetF domain-containing protein [Kineobactrum salinum]QIB65330.1 DUF421 domain-containing protein [Kineobactrum salinum]